ncbi:unnamed protein product [Psylliodes chrysocephalus]|uniref:Uncharacterized protein n=1 Tax=Psylliodes chrysocephalus TaxID=3402493 RepID=A0A9P0CHM1_9CUCU|nr:unnamed protein product [Psylliodes chrysocephala]
MLFNTAWIKGYREFTWDGDKLFYTVCSKIIHADKKLIVDQHAKCSKHILNMQKSEGGTSQQTLKTCIKQSAKHTVQQKQFNEELYKAMITSNILLAKLNNPNLRQFLGKFLDETTDSCGRYIAHALIGVLEEATPGRSYLFASKKLEKANNLTITRFAQDFLTNFFLPDAIPGEKCILFLSDAAPYMVKAG